MKSKLMMSLVVLLVAVSVLAVSAQDTTTVDDAISESVSDDNALSIDDSDNAIYREGDRSGNVKEVWIDNTVDASRIDLEIAIMYYDASDPDAPVTLATFTNSTSAQYSTIDSSDICNQTLNYRLAYIKNGEGLKNIRVVSIEKHESIGEVYDHRTYRTVEAGDAQLIGDEDYLKYLNGDYDLGSTITHIAEGEYAKVLHTFLDVTAEYNYNETEDAPEPAGNNTQNNTGVNATDNAQSNAGVNATDNAQNNTGVNATDNANNAVNASDKNVTNNTNTIPKDVAKATGIPFAVLIVALLSVGVSIIRRR